ncbi:MAG: hypothetical protein AAGG72_01590 [Pseudomonadota bacterium]
MQQTYTPLLFVTAIASVFAMVWAVGMASSTLTLWASLVLPLSAICYSLWLNKPWRFEPATTPALTTAGSDESLEVSRTNAKLMGTIYVWGGAAMFAAYTLTDLWWWHSWQYGLAMLAIGGALFAYATWLKFQTDKAQAARILNGAAWLALGQAVAAVVALGFLFTTGKIEAMRSDWVANYIFLTGGLSVAIVSLFAAISRWRATRQPQPRLNQSAGAHSAS